MKSPSSRDITVLFVDIVGFSIVSQKMRSPQIFSLLKTLLDVINLEVLAHGGVIDKILGDGALCYFANDPSLASGAQNHAIRAVACAVQIQKEIFKVNLKHVAEGIPCLPIRIGINTAVVYIGEINLNGVETSLVIGEGVDFAKRLEQVCTENTILISPITYKLAASAINQRYLGRIFIKIKHSENFYNAYSLNPLIDFPSHEVGKVLSNYRDSVGLSRGPKRFAIRRPLMIHTNGRPGEIIDFSNGGLRVVLPVRYSKGISLPVFIGSFDSEIAKALSSVNLQPAICQVMWSKSDTDRNEHGLRLEFGSNRHAKSLFDIIGEYNLAGDHDLKVDIAKVSGDT